MRIMSHARPVVVELPGDVAAEVDQRLIGGEVVIVRAVFRTRSGETAGVERLGEGRWALATVEAGPVAEYDSLLEAVWEGAAR